MIVVDFEMPVASIDYQSAWDKMIARLRNAQSLYPPLRRSTHERYIEFQRQMDCDWRLQHEYI